MCIFCYGQRKMATSLEIHALADGDPCASLAAAARQRWDGRSVPEPYVSVPITDDRHLFSALRYVEKNALEAGLVQPGGRLALVQRLAGGRAISNASLSTSGPFPRLTNWLDILNDVRDGT